MRSATARSSSRSPASWNTKESSNNVCTYDSQGLSKAVEEDAYDRMCELIDYIGHYPSTWPVPTEQEKNPKMEALMEEYDIIVRYHLDDDLAKMQITSDTVVRIIDKLFENLEKLNDVKSNLLSNDWLLTVKLNSEKREQLTSEIIQEVEQFPLSDYQKREKSEREEGKKYLKLQYGSNIIK